MSGGQAQNVPEQTLLRVLCFWAFAGPRLSMGCLDQRCPNKMPNRSICTVERAVYSMKDH